MYNNGDDDGLGVAPIVAAALVDKVGSIPIIGGLFKQSKDPERLAANAKAYNDGLSNPNTVFSGMDGKSQGVTPLAFLLMKSPVVNGGQGGWATDLAQQDAWKKYNALRSVYGNSTQTPQVPSTYVPVPNAPIPPILQGQQPPLYGGTPNVPPAFNTAGMFSNPMVLISLAGLGMLALSQLSGGSSRRRR